MKRIAVIGSGVVGEALSAGFLGAGYEVMRASRRPEKLSEWLASAGDAASAGTFAEAAAWGQAVVLAVKGSAAERVLDLCGPENLAGKIVIDPTNPIADGPPEHGVLRYFTGSNESLLERLQARVPAARFVKAFSCVGASQMVHPAFEGGPPTMLICGNDEVAREWVATLVRELGWEVEDLGPAEAARAIEPVGRLGLIPLLRGTAATIAFKLLRK